MPASWHSVHVYYHYYHDPDKDALLLDAVRPLLDEVRDRVAAAYVLRHWRQGPHLRINVRAEQRVWDEVVRPRIDAVIGAHLRAHPSTTVLDPEESLTRHQLLALREEEDGPLTPWPPDNSIRDAPFDSRRHVMGSDDAVELLTDFYSDTTDLLFAMLGHARAGHDTKPDLCMNLMLTVAHTSYGLDNVVSFRVHAEAYLNFSADPVAACAAFDRAYESRRAELTQRVRDVIAALDDPTAPPVPFVREWAALLARYRRRTSELLASGRMVLPEARLEEPRLGDIPILRRDPGEFVRLIFTNPAYRETVFGSPAFQCYRVLLNFTYLHPTRMGLTPLDRFRLCHLTASAAEDTYNVSALDLIRRFTDAHPAPA